MKTLRTNNARGSTWFQHQRSGPSLSALLTAWYTTASFLVVAIATGSLYFGLASNLRRISERSLLDQLDVCRALAAGRGEGLHLLQEEVEIDSGVRRYAKVYIRVFDASGAALWATAGMDRELSSSSIGKTAAKRNGIFRIDSTRGVPYLSMVTTVPRDSGSTLNLQLAVDLTQEREILGRQRIWVWTVLAGALMLCPGVGLAIARRGTRPLREVAETARHIGSSTLNERIRERGYPMEVRVMAEAFNAMLERLEESFSRLSRFSADIAHELRTPVNNIRGEAEVALARTRTVEEYSEALGSCLEESVRLSELIESLLFLARSESPGDHLKRTPEDLGRTLADLCDYYEARATELGITLTSSVEDGLVAVVDRTLLQRALGNLISNALAHCSPGDSVRLNARSQEGRIQIEVCDTGSGISPADIPRVFDRFYRADPARSRNFGGTGLGLAIVQQIAVLHGGDVQIRSNQEGGGTKVTLVLP